MPLTASNQIFPVRSHRNPTLSIGALSLLAIVFAGPASQAQAQAAPQVLPYIHTIVAGNGTQLVPVTKAGNASSPVHGSEVGDGGPATAASIASPTHIVVDSLGNVYFTDSTSNVRKVDTAGNITTFAGGLTTGAGDCATATDNFGDGCPANESFLRSPYGIAIDPATGAIYVAENFSSSSRIRKIDPTTYTITAVVDAPGTSGSVDGALPTGGQLKSPRGIAVDKHGNLYIMDEGNFALRLANFATGQLTTIVNAVKAKATATTCAADAAAGGIVASAGSLGVASGIAFDNNDNLYIADATCLYVFKVAENPVTGMVDANSTMTVVMGSGLSTPAPTVFTNQPGSTLNFTPSGVVADLQGNLYVGESTGNHVWFWDHATGSVHTVFGGGTPGSCFGQASSGAAPYNGCDGNDSALIATKGTAGLALDAWGNLYITDTAAAYVHKLSLGTNAPTSTIPGGYANAILHIGANDAYSSINTALAPDFTFTQQVCTTNNSATPAGDNTQDCTYLVTNTNPSAGAQYEQVTVTTTAALKTAIPLTNQAIPTCQGATATSKSILATGSPLSVTLSSQPGAACTGVETMVAAPHKYTYAVVTGPTHGTLSGTAPNLTYTPTAGYTGADSITFSVTDTSAYSAATVPYDGGASSVVMEQPAQLAGSIGTITMQPYTVPVATAQSVTVTYSISKNVTLAGTDSNSAALIFAIVTQPAHGTLSGTAPNLVYTPNSTYFGADSFTFTVNDGLSTSAPATVSLTVNPPPPTAANPSVSVNYQTATAVTLSATGQGPFTYVVTTPPQNGTLTGTAPNLTYTPTGTYVGTDSIVYSVSNAGGTSSGTVSITVQPAPVIPVAQNSSATVAFNTATAITAVAGGGNGHALTYSVATGPAHGTLGAFTGAVAIYTPTTGYVGADSFTFKVTDGTSTSTAATVFITVNQAAPVANSQSVTTAFATAVSVTLVATGPPTITYAVVAAPAHGTLSGTAPSLTYTPASNFAGADSFTFKANNGGDSNIATVSITVTAPPVPSVSNSSASVNYQTATPITLTATGLGTITYAVTVQPAHGTLTGTAPSLTYTPATGYSGPDTFTYTASNPGGASGPAVVSITVLPLPPVAQAQTVTDSFNGVLPVTLSATGTGPFTYAVTQPVSGHVVLSGAIATYTPPAGYVGPDSFTFTANNGSVSNTAKISITVLPAVPVASSQSVNVAFNAPQAITLTAIGASPTYAIVTQPTNGTVTLSGATATYTPATNFAGSDTFTFTATNAGGTSNIATVSITVAGGFNWAAASGGSLTATVTNGQTATYNLQFSGWKSSAGVQVSLACSGAPILCNVAPNPATLNGVTAVPVTVTINTLTTSVVPSGFLLGTGRMRPWLLLLNLVWLALIVPQARRRRWISRMVIAVAAIAVLASVSGCGGNIPEKAFGTPPGTYTFSVTASAPGAASTSQVITLTVN